MRDNPPPGYDKRQSCAVPLRSLGRLMTSEEPSIQSTAPPEFGGPACTLPSDEFTNIILATARPPALSMAGCAITRPSGDHAGRAKTPATSTLPTLGSTVTNVGPGDLS